MKRINMIVFHYQEFLISANLLLTHRSSIFVTSKLQIIIELSRNNKYTVNISYDI